MTGAWIFLPRQWSLENVQAVINVVVSILSAILIVVFAQIRWQWGATRITRQKQAKISSLLDISSPGEALDFIWLFRARALRKRYLPALLQCLAVIVLTAAATLSGPIARYSTRTRQQVNVVSVNGSLALTGKPETQFDTATIRATYDRLQDANFPTNQMLDFLPDASIPWVYNPKEWNSTWAADCIFIPETKITLNATGNYSIYKTDPNNPYALLNEIQPLQSVWPREFQYGHAPRGIYGQDAISYGNYWPADYSYQDEVLFMPSFLYSNASDAAWAAIWPRDSWVNMSIAAVYMHGGPVPQETTDNIVGDFGVGMIPESYYTRVDCNMSRVRGSEDAIYQAYPNTRFIGQISESYNDHFLKDFFIAANANRTVVLPTGQDLLRLFQAYTVTKDTEYSGVYATRDISVKFQTVQLSTVFLAFAILAALVAILGGLFILQFVIRHNSIWESTPHSKIDWMIQAATEAHTADRYLQNGNHKSSMQSPASTSTMASDLQIFEDATYGTDGHSTRAVSQRLHRITTCSSTRSPTVVAPDRSIDEVEKSVAHDKPDSKAGVTVNVSGSRSSTD